MTFDEVAEALRYTHRNEGSVAKCMAAYKEAFDYFRNLEFKGDGGEVTFEVMPREEWFTPGSLPLLANNVEGDYWGNTVGKTVVYPQDNPFTDAQLAGAILWGMTFYGFSPRNLWRPTEKCNSICGTMANVLAQRQYMPYIRSKWKRRELKRELERARIDNRILEVGFSEETWRRIHYQQGQNHQNRQKRKRFYRISKRIEDLQRIDRRIGLIREMSTAIGGEISTDLYIQIISAAVINEYIAESRSYGTMSRSEYILELIAKYGLFDELALEEVDKVVVIYTSSVSSPIDYASEAEQITSVLREYVGGKGIGPGCVSAFIGTDDTECGEMALRVLVVSRIGACNNV